MPSPAGNSAVALCNAALLLCGAEELNSFLDETREAKICNTLYPMERDALLTAHPWKFTLAVNPLNRLDETPLDTRWQYAFSLPADCLEVLADIDRKPYRLGEGSRLLANNDTITLLYQLQPDETRFSPTFALALQYQLASQLALALMEDGSKSDRLGERHRLQLRRARYLDAKQQPPVGWPDSAYSIVAARYSGVGSMTGGPLS